MYLFYTYSGWFQNNKDNILGNNRKCKLKAKNLDVFAFEGASL